MSYVEPVTPVRPGSHRSHIRIGRGKKRKAWDEEAGELYRREVCVVLETRSGATEVT